MAWIEIGKKGTYSNPQPQSQCDQRISICDRTRYSGTNLVNRVQPTPQRPLPIYLRHPRWCAYTLAALYAFITGLVNIASNIDLLHHLHAAYMSWEPYVWEYSSAIVVLTALPLIVAFDRRLPISWSTWRFNLLRHGLAIVIFSAYKVGGATLLRKLAYAVMGEHFALSSLPSGIGSTFLSDARLYLEIMAVTYAYRFILLQLRGEARVFANPEVGAPVESLERPQRFLVRKLGKEFLVAVDDIERLEAQGNYVNLHVRGRVYPLRSTMSSIEAKLDPKKFVRTHRSHIVNLDYLLEIHPSDAGDASLILRGGNAVPCSRNYRSSLRGKSASDPMSA